MLTLQKDPTFELGTVVGTPSALRSFTDKFLSQCLERHAQRDWGDCCDEDKKENDRSIEEGGGALSVYKGENRTLWIITEGDHSATTLLMPEEY